MLSKLLISHTYASHAAGVRPLAIAHLLVLSLGAPATAQTGPQISVALDPDGPVTVGTAVEVTATVLVPSYMPKPPVWPDLQIADAITRLPERATHPVTQRVGGDSWSGVARTWEIIPQRPADYDLGPAEIVVTYADPETNAPTETRVPLPDIAFTATVPPGGKDIDPFLAATKLTVEAKLDGLPDTPKPGEAFTLTLTTTASGPPAMLLPPLADRLPVPPGLRAYPRQPALTDGGPASRTEAIAYVIEAPGQYRLPELTVAWWNTATATRETATTAPLSIDVPAPPGFRAPGSSGRPGLPVVAGSALALLAAAGVAWWAWRRHTPRQPTERSLYRRLRRSIRSDPPAAIRDHLAAWDAASPHGRRTAVDDTLRSLERRIYGPPVNATSEAALRTALLGAVSDARRTGASPPFPALTRALPPLNPGMRPQAEETAPAALASAPGPA